MQHNRVSHLTYLLDASENSIDDFNDMRRVNIAILKIRLLLTWIPWLLSVLGFSYRFCQHCCPQYTLSSTNIQPRNVLQSTLSDVWSVLSFVKVKSTVGLIVWHHIPPSVAFLLLISPTIKIPHTNINIHLNVGSHRGQEKVSFHPPELLFSGIQGHLVTSAKSCTLCGCVFSCFLLGNWLCHKYVV